MKAISKRDVAQCEEITCADMQAKSIDRVGWAMESLKKSMKWDEDTFGATLPIAKKFNLAEKGIKSRRSEGSASTDEDVAPDQAWSTIWTCSTLWRWTTSTWAPWRTSRSTSSTAASSSPPPRVCLCLILPNSACCCLPAAIASCLSRPQSASADACRTGFIHSSPATTHPA